MSPTTLDDLVSFFELKHQNEKEPWEYSERAVELLRQEFIVRRALAHKPSFRNALDVGCSLGQLTHKLDGMCGTVYGIDVSRTALSKASAIRATQRGDSGTRFFFVAANAAALPFLPGNFELILLCDGLMTWRLSKRTIQIVLGHTNNLLSADGIVVLTDYMHPGRFDSFIDLIQQSPLTIYSIHYMNDRVCYQLESLLQAFHRTSFVKSVIGNRGLARALILLGKLFRKHGSKHLCVVAGKGKIEEG